ncbi:FliG C-terminal domain-containing protein [Pigmentibacter sp. JX0631]|uniref:FliG C-terminal domain-containing protein n=1 Tax=Pigmentibacter sp. JX0631 TaxID=2976982 RepID=UPI00246849AA|nr:FliG C-terminal domain-containing protein [Pigmentibacter sp. JX0631]WGL59906.1 FliG C-terminal domain-containing protein [Pigmentibacter sp. JX0631]
MTPSQKAAAILALAGEENAAKLIQNIPEFETKKILRAFSRLPTLSEKDIEKLAKEFVELVKKIDSYNGAFTLDRAKQILSKANLTLKDPSWIETISDSYLLDEIRKILDNIYEKILIQWLKLEHPQTIALILSIASPDKCSSIFRQVNENVRTEILLRISILNHVDTPELENVHEELEKLQKNMNLRNSTPNGIEKITQMLQATNSEFRTQLLAGLGSKNPDLANKIAYDLLTLSRISELNSNHLSILCSNLSDQVLSLGLRLEDESIKEKYLSCVAKKRRHLIEGEWENGKVQKKLVENAVSTIIKKAIELKEKGKITFPWEETLV